MKSLFIALTIGLLASCSKAPEAPKDPSSLIGQKDQFGAVAIADVPKLEECSRKYVSVKLDTFQNCIVDGLTYVQVANTFGYAGKIQAESGNSKIYQWNGRDGVVMGSFVDGRLVAKSQSGLH
jgi:hypothetical protein